MNVMTCEMCGSTDLIKQDGFYVCQHCGTKYSVDEARKLLGVVKIDKTEETTKLLSLARRARESNNSENAEKYYGMVLQESPDNWEANFFQVYYHAMQCKLINITSSNYDVANICSSTVKLIAGLADETEKSEALNTVVRYAVAFAHMTATASINHYNSYSTVDGAKAECIDRVVSGTGIFMQLEDSMKNFASAYKTELATLQKEYISFLSKYGKYYNGTQRDSLISRLKAEVSSQDSSYIAPEVQSGGCYIATAVYGSYDCPQVWTLRRFRDNDLASTWYGRLFIHIYYAVSPTIVNLFGNTEWFKRMWRGKLDKMVAELQKKGYEATPYEDKNW